MASSSSSTSHTPTLGSITTAPADDGRLLTGTTLLQEISVAIDEDDVTKLKSLLDNTHDEVNINKIPTEGSKTSSLLTIAIKRNKYNVFKYMLKRQDIDVNAIYNTVGYSPLHFAAFTGEPIYTTLLLQHGADVNAQDVDGNTPLHMAILGVKNSSRFDVVKLLLDNGAPFNRVDKYKKTPIDVINDIDTSTLSDDEKEDVKKIKDILLCRAMGKTVADCAVMGGRAPRKSKTKSKRSHKKIRRRRRSKKQLSKK